MKFETPPRPEPTAHMLILFGVEIRNEDLGGERPSTLRSVEDSLAQADDAVVADWTDGGRRDALLTEIIALIHYYSEDALLSDWPGA